MYQHIFRRAFLYSRNINTVRFINAPNCTIAQSRTVKNFGHKDDPEPVSGRLWHFYLVSVIFGIVFFHDWLRENWIPKYGFFEEGDEERTDPFKRIIMPRPEE